RVALRSILRGRGPDLQCGRRSGPRDRAVHGRQPGPGAVASGLARVRGDRSPAWPDARRTRVPSSTLGYPPTGVGFGPPPVGGPGPVLGLAERLLDETTAFINAFAPTAGKVPEGRGMFMEAQQLQAATANF
ncbi:unnamed protein product, partial [Phaeothamnion confervicola]